MLLTVIALYDKWDFKQHALKPHNFDEDINLIPEGRPVPYLLAVSERGIMCVDPASRGIRRHTKLQAIPQLGHFTDNKMGHFYFTTGDPLSHHEEDAQRIFVFRCAHGEELEHLVQKYKAATRFRLDINPHATSPPPQQEEDGVHAREVGRGTMVPHQFKLLISSPAKAAEEDNENGDVKPCAVAEEDAEGEEDSGESKEKDTGEKLGE